MISTVKVFMKLIFYCVINEKNHHSLDKLFAYLWVHAIFPALCLKQDYLQLIQRNSSYAKGK